MHTFLHAPLWGFLTPEHWNLVFLSEKWKLWEVFSFPNPNIPISEENIA